MKKCIKCGILKNLDDFYIRANNKTTNICKACCCSDKKEYYQKNRERIGANAKVYHQKNIEKQKAYHKFHYKENKTKIKKRQKLYRNENKEVITKRNREGYKKYREKRLIAKAVYYQKNKETLKTKSSIYQKENREELNSRQRETRRNNFKVRLNHNISNRIRISLKGNKAGRPWEDIVGYTLSQLKRHLGRLFTIGMTWENYGKGGWEIDHKIPVKVFNYTKPNHRDFKKCWALKNLQPMWKKENMDKGATLSKHFQPSLLM